MSEAAFPIVGIGASAGGIDALAHFFRGLPSDSGCAFVIVTHLSPDRPSLLPEIVARFTPMPVHDALDGTVPQVNQVYVLPSDAILGIANRRLTSRAANSIKRERKPIDVFLSQLAKDVGEYAVGVILSGGDGDGTLGVKAIKERGGFTLAQTGDGSEPQHAGMPRSAIASGMIDAAIPVEEMGRVVADFARSFDMLERLEASDPEDSRRLLRDARANICAALRNQVGHDFSGYKEKTFFRRVQRRMQVNHLETLQDYIENLRQDPKEVGALFRDLLINVTNFFRDAEAFAALETSVIPKLFAGRGADETVRAWVPGCATGEEVFSIAIQMREHMDTLSAVPRVQIFATDIDEAALGVARAGRYPEALLDSVSPARRKRFFTLEDGSYVLTKDVRELCIFSPHSVIRDPPFSRLDLISCRNLLIYFGPDMQKQVIPTFHYALSPGGYLFLGTSENVTQFSDLFVAIDKKHRIFRSREDAPNHARVPLAVNGLRPAPFAVPERRSSKPPGGAALRPTVEAQVLDHFAPAHVVVNRDGDVVYYSSRTGKYLEATAGLPTRQILTMARKGLRLDLRTMLRDAIETGQRIVREGVSAETEDERIQIVNISVEPIRDGSFEEPLFLVIFADVGKLLSRQEAAQRATAPDDAAVDLERELRDTRERLLSLIEEYETALEELKSSNEELVSVNEELQSTNEELEASKEELQSVNEELHTVNAELNGKVEMLDRSNSDLTNLFESTRVATVFLDRDLVIRSYTPAVSQIFNILPGDRGRPLTDLASRFSLPTLADDVRAVFKSGETLERAVDPDGTTHFLLRLVPYRSQDTRIEGVVLSFVDVTSLTRAEEHQRRLIAELNHRVKNMLAIVIGIAEQTYRKSSDSATFKARLVERIQGMARSYELLSRENWRAARFEELARKHLEPFGIERVSMKKADIRLPPRQALSLGMILHELATNAAKYGALGAPEGRIGIEWAEEDGEAPAIVFRWKEIGGPRVEKPGRDGFGVKLIRQEATYALRGSARIEFKPEGLDVMVRFPRAERDEDE